MLRLELTFLYLASGGGCNARGCAKGQKYQLQLSFSYGDHTRVRGPYVVDPVLSGAFFLTFIFPQPRRPILKIPVASATPE